MVCLLNVRSRRLLTSLFVLGCRNQSSSKATKDPLPKSTSTPKEIYYSQLLKTQSLMFGTQVMERDWERSMDIMGVFGLLLVIVSHSFIRKQRILRMLLLILFAPLLRIVYLMNRLLALQKILPLDPNSPNEIPGHWSSR
jgi:hypothetical protein